MTDIWTQPWFWPAVAVVVGLPVALLFLTELQSTLERRGSRAARIVLLIRNFVVPTGALLLLLSQAKYAHIDFTWTQAVATVFGFLIILVLLNGLNFALFVTAKEGTWRSKLPTIFVDIVRVVIILVSLAVLFSVVWGADVGGVFTALGVGSIVIGLALQNAVGSIVSGLLLLFEAPFKLGDWIETGGVRGRIIEVNWRATHVKTANGVEVIPNSNLAGGSFLNVSRNDAPFATDFFVKFSTDDPPQEVIAVCMQVAAGLPNSVDAADITPWAKAKYEIEIPIDSPAHNFGTIRLFNTRLWYAARRAGLHLDRDLTDNYNTPERVLEVLGQFAPHLYLGPEDAEAIAPRVTLERYAAGEVLQQAYVIPDGMRFVVSGAATIGTPVDVGAEVKFSILDRGDVLGLTALTRQGVAAIITATTEMAVLFVPTSVLDELVTTRPQLARDIGKEIDNRRTLAYSALSAAGIDVPSGSRLIA
ncbi:MAG: mechanosensitive ion channel family protein [Rhodoglobus sp.]